MLQFTSHSCADLPVVYDILTAIHRLKTLHTMLVLTHHDFITLMC